MAPGCPDARTLQNEISTSFERRVNKDTDTVTVVGVPPEAVIVNVNVTLIV